jgi:NAD dependent epimerase/dehydratase family enzyme
MNVIITGATGFIGEEVVHQAIASENIKHAFVLTRKALPDEISKNDKITVIEHADFSAFPEKVISKLTGAEGCIW